MAFSGRVPGPSSPNAWSAALAERRCASQALLDLTESNPTRCHFRSHGPGLLKGLSKKGSLSYSPDPRGQRAAREAVCAYYAKKGKRVRPEQVFLTASTSEAYHFLFRLLCDAADRVAFAEPSYPLLDSLLSLDDVAPSRYRLCYDGGWKLDADSLAKAVSGAKALIVVDPNNPTGHFISAAERVQIESVCRKEKAALIADEVFGDFSWKEDAPESFVGSAAPSFTLSGISKALGLPQMKLSWIVVGGPADFQKEACERLETIADAYLSVNTPSQQALPHWLRSADAVTKEICDRVRQNRRSLEKELKGNPRAQVLDAEGGWYSLVYFDSESDDEAMALHLLRERSVAVQPGYLYDLPERMLVLSLLPRERDFLEGVRRMVEAF